MRDRQYTLSSLLEPLLFAVEPAEEAGDDFILPDHIIRGDLLNARN